MADTILSTKGKDITLDRTFKSSPSFNPPQDLRLGIEQSSITTGTQVLDQPIPVKKGTILDDGTNQLSGSNGGDNTTDNTNTFKQTADLSETKAQNLEVNSNSATKEWSLTYSTSSNEDRKHSVWLYFDDQQTIDLIADVEVRFEDTSSDYYSLTVQDSDLSTGWNFIALGVLKNNSETGSVSGTIDGLRIIITTDNAGDTWSSGKAVYDAARQWQPSDEKISQNSGYPVVDSSADEVTQRFTVTTLQANGFLLDGGLVETSGGDAYNSSNGFNLSKSNTDEFIFQVRNRIL